MRLFDLYCQKALFLVSGVVTTHQHAPVWSAPRARAESPCDRASALSLGHRIGERWSVSEGAGAFWVTAHRYCIWYYAVVTLAKHQRILESMFSKPTPAGIRWTDIVTMLEAAGVEVSQRSGSRVLLKKVADRMVIHRPHPETETGRATVRDIAAFLESIGVNP